MMRPVYLPLMLVLAGLAVGFVFLLHSRPSVEAYARYQVPADSPAANTVTATFLGVSTVLLSDGETAILTDGFFTRPGPALSLLLGATADRLRHLVKVPVLLVRATRDVA